MKAIDYDNMSDDEFAKMFEEFDNKMDIFLEKDDFFNRFVAYFIAEEYREKLLPRTSLDVMIKTALESINLVNTSKEKIKEYLKNQYNLEIINEDNLTFKEL